MDHGADPNIATDDGWTPLMLACQRKGVPATVEVLLKYKPNLDHENNLGMSAYGLARWNNLNEIMTILEKAGARKRLLVGDVTKSVVQLKPLWSIAKKFGYMYRKGITLQQNYNLNCDYFARVYRVQIITSHRKVQRTSKSTTSCIY